MRVRREREEREGKESAAGELAAAYGLTGFSVFCALDTISSVSVHVCRVFVWAPVRVRECITVTSRLCLS